MKAKKMFSAMMAGAMALFCKNRIQISPLKRNSNAIWKMRMQSINW